MKKQLLTILSIASLAINCFAQTDRSQMMPCGTYEAMEEGFKTNPQLKKQYEASQAQFEIDYQKELSRSKYQKTAATIYTVPVVFHIMGNQSITDQKFIDLIAAVNKDYARTGSDTGTISPAFKSLYKDAEIRFALAKRDPTGKCTNGIIRHSTDSPYWSQTSPNYAYSGTGTSRWPVNQYLNVYVVECISSATYSCPTTGGAYLGGYTYKPGSTPYTTNGNMGDAIVYLKSLLDPTDSRTLSHEIGHWLNLSHTFGNNNCTGGTACGTTDGISDTPITTCNFGTCPASVGSNTCDPSGNVNVENIMDYSSCPKMFTQGQITAMRTAIQSATGGRNNLWAALNYSLTGLASGYTCSPVADFTSNKAINCSGTSVTYTSTGQIGESGSLLWSFQGGSPATSTATSQVVSYATPGTYSVGLVALNASGTNTVNRASYIKVVNGNGGVILPNSFDFEAATLPSSITVVNGNAGSVTWSLNPTYGSTLTTKSIYLNNFPSTNIGGHIDIFETPFYDFSTTTAITMNFYYAYAKRSATQSDTFKVQYSLDCGGSWTTLLGSPTTLAMATASGGTLTTAFTPSLATKWIYKNFTTGTMSALWNKPSVKFRFYFRADPNKTTANNLYIDQINILGTVSIPTAITELEKTINLAIYPNPTASTSTLDFTIPNNKNAIISLTDMMGRVMEQEIAKSDDLGNVKYVINQNGNLASGVYIVNIEVDGQRISKKLIIE